MSIRSAVVLCRDKVTQSIEASVPKEKAAYSKEAEFALSVLAEAMDSGMEIASGWEDWEEESNDFGNDSQDNNPAELDGVSTDENPEDETKEERMEKERSRGFFG